MWSSRDGQDDLHQARDERRATGMRHDSRGESERRFAEVCRSRGGSWASGRNRPTRTTRKRVSFRTHLLARRACMGTNTSGGKRGSRIATGFCRRRLWGDPSGNHSTIRVFRHPSGEQKKRRPSVSRFGGVRRPAPNSEPNRDSCRTARSQPVGQQPQDSKRGAHESDDL